MTDSVTERVRDSGPARASTSPAADSFWRAVERLLESKLGDSAGICAHGLGPLAADMLEHSGRPVPLTYLHEQRAARVATLAAPGVLARVRELWRGPMLLLKGPDLAHRYPQHARAFVDLDLLVGDAAEAQRTLVAAGFREEEDPDGVFVGIHHLTPLRWPQVPLRIELHMEPKWPEGLVPPSNDELFEASVPAAVGVSDIFAPAPAHHALLTAAHAWAHQPLARVRDLLDVGVLAVEVEPAELAELARSWNIAAVWQTTASTLAALLAGTRTAPLRLWARHVVDVREQTVFEHHLERLLAPFWGLSTRPATRQAARALADEFRPAFDETWSEKLRRSTKAMRRASSSTSTHRESLGDSAARGRKRNTPPK